MYWVGQSCRQTKYFKIIIGCQIKSCQQQRRTKAINYPFPVKNSLRTSIDQRHFSLISDSLSLPVYRLDTDNHFNFEWKWFSMKILTHVYSHNCQSQTLFIEFLLYFITGYIHTDATRDWMGIHRTVAGWGLYVSIYDVF